MYKFYATLLDGYQYFLHSDSETAMQKFLDKINRVPFESEPTDTGTAFNELIDKLLKTESFNIQKEPDIIPYHFINKTGRVYNFGFKREVVKEFTDRLHGAASQVHTEAVLNTSKGTVLLYGYIDEVLINDVTDIKTTGKYEFPKFLHAWQHKVYPYCLEKQGIIAETFTYRITDFNNYFEEVYPVNNAKAESDLIGICENLIDFIEMNRDKITDTKIFGG